MPLRTLRVLRGSLVVFLFLISVAHSKILFHSDFERGETYLAKAVKPGAKSIELVPNFRLEEWPVDSGEGVIEGNLRAQTDAFRYARREGSRLYGVSGIGKAHAKWCGVRTWNLWEWDSRSLYHSSGSTLPPKPDGKRVLFGDYSARFDCLSENDVVLAKGVEFQSEGWIHCRFYLLSTGPASLGAGIEELPVSFVTLHQLPFPRVVLFGAKARANNGAGFSRRPSSMWRTLNRKTAGSMSIDSGKAYCLEYGVRMLDSTSGELRLWVDGILCEELTVEFSVPKGTHHYMNVGKLSRLSIPATLWIDEVVIADSAIGLHPPKPVVVWRNNRLGAREVGEVYSIAGHQWQVSSSNAWLMPVFNSGEWPAGKGVLEPGRFKLHGPLNRDIVLEKPMLVPTGVRPNISYLVRLRYKDTNGHWGDWCDPLSFRSPDAGDSGYMVASELPEIEQAFISRPGSRKPLQSIQRGIWHDVHLKCRGSSEPGIKGRCFVDLYFSGDPENCVSNHHNRGGSFSEQSNYPVSFDMRTRGIYAKEPPHTDAFQRIGGRPGAYVDGTQGKVAVESNTGQARFRFRLLSSAHLGPWSLKGFFRDRHARISPTYTQVFHVVEKGDKATAGRGWFAVGAIGLALIAVMWLARKRSAPRGQKGLEPSDSEGREKPGAGNERIDAAIKYIEENYTQPIFPRDVASAIGLTPNWLATVFREGTGKTVGEHLCELRIDKAKSLLTQSNTSISEIALKVGFNSFNSFRDAFKRIEGISAASYRKKNQSTT